MQEMVQNADDAGASTFRVLLDCRTHPASSLLAPAMAKFQGPALLVYNDAVFTDTDFESIQHIGGSRKTEAEASATRDERTCCQTRDHLARKTRKQTGFQADFAIRLAAAIRMSTMIAINPVIMIAISLEIRNAIRLAITCNH